MTPLVSVIMAVRDADSTLVASLQSVSTQTFTRFEFIIIDDGSSDRTGAILRAAAEKDPRILVHPQSPSGLAVSLNRAIALAKGQYVARQDADDISMPTRLALQVERLEMDTDLGALGTAATVINADGHVTGRFPTAHGVSAVRRGLLSCRITPVHGSMMVRRDCLAHVDGYREAFPVSQDFDLWLRLIEHVEIDNLTELLYQWRASKESLHGTKRRQQLYCSGIAMAFAAERKKYGRDSYDLLVQHSGDMNKFSGSYQLRGYLYALWADLMLRGLNDLRTARKYFYKALSAGYCHPRVVALFIWVLLGLPWPGGKPLQVSGDKLSSHK